MAESNEDRNKRPNKSSMPEPSEERGATTQHGSDSYAHSPEDEESLISTEGAGGGRRAQTRQQDRSGGRQSGPSKAHQRELAVQRDDMASRTKRPERTSGLDQLESPGMLIGGGALAYWGLKHWKSAFGLMLAGVGSGLIYQGLKKNGVLDGGANVKEMLLNTGASKSTQVRASITVDAPIDQVYAYWCDPKNLSRSMKHIESVRRDDDTHWHWRAHVPKSDDMYVEWNSEIIEARENELVVWRSVKGSEIHNEGMVQFRSRPNEDSTEVHARIVYYPPAGSVGQTIGRFLKGVNEQIIKEDLRRFKQLVELGEVPTTEGQTSGRASFDPSQAGSEPPRSSLR